MQCVVFSPAARTEVTDAQDWYESEAQGLGRRFRDEVEAVVHRIEANPLLFSPAYKNVRRARLRNFPYALYFCVLPDSLFVIACFHSSRDPQRWQRRI